MRRLFAKHLKQFSQNVIRLRNDTGMTQEELAEKDCFRVFAWRSRCLTASSFLVLAKTFR